MSHSNPGTLAKALPGRLQMVVLLALACLVRLPGLGESLWYDEVYYSSQKLLSPTWQRWVFEDVHPPLYGLLMRLWLSLVPENEVTLRLPVLMLGLLSILYTAKLTERLVADSALAEPSGSAVAWSGWMAGLFLALAPSHIWYSQENKANMLALTCVAAALYYAYQSSWSKLALASLGGLFTHTFCLPALGALWLSLAPGHWRSSHFRWAALATWGLSGVQILQQVWRVAMVDKSYLGDLHLAEFFSYVTRWLPFGNTHDWVALQWAWALLLVWGHWKFLRNQLWPPILAVLWLPLLATMLASYLVPHFFIERNLLVVYPAYAVIVGVALSQPPRSVPWKLLLWVGISSYGLLQMWLWKAEQTTVYKPNPDFRAVARWLAQQSERQILTFEGTGGPDPLLFYEQRCRIRQMDESEQLEPFEISLYRMPSLAHYSLIGAVLQRSKSRDFYFLHELTWPRDSPQIVERLRQDQRWRLLKKVHFRCYDVWHFAVCEPFVTPTKPLGVLVKSTP